MSHDPSLLQMAEVLGGPDLVHRLRQTFRLYDDLDPRMEGFLHFIAPSTVSHTADDSPDPGIPESVLDLAHYARCIHGVKEFVETTEDQFQIPRLLEDVGSHGVPKPGAASVLYSTVERTLIWDDPSSDSDVSTLTVLRGLLYLALLSGETRILQQRQAIARALISGSGGRLARLHTDEIRQHEAAALFLLTEHLKDPAAKRDELRQLLRDIVGDRLTVISKWHDPVTTYRDYRAALLAAGVRPPWDRKPNDPRYRGGFTLDDLRSPGRAQLLYGSSNSYIDEERLDVLDELIELFGEDRCTLMRGEFNAQNSLDVDTSTIDRTYVILVIKARDEGPWQEDAIAISPFAGAHGVYYVRSDVSQKTWQDVLAAGKLSARNSGARSLRFRPRDIHDEYEAMALKLQALSECNAEAFLAGKLTYDELAMDYTVERN
ncbi:hypothetical protein ACFYVR_23440 [Rhodococcus sp. NPDC003318]|uniref:hypothetical protein n=1 Tax=Rhodococcus sp. NPDC003318 TaxID=3364503 RepID=UPI0036BF47FF